MKKIIDYIVLLIWAYMMIVIPPFLLIYVIYTFAPGWEIFAKISTQTPDFTTLMLMALFFPGLGALLLFVSKREKPVVVWRYGINRLLADFTVSFMISLILWRFFGVLRDWGIPGLLLICFFLVFYLPQAALFLGAISLTDFGIFFSIDYRNIKVNKPQFKRRYFILLFRTLAIISLAVAFVLLVNRGVSFGNKKIVAYKKEQVFLSRHPYIKKGEPSIVYHSNKIVLYGKNFGWRTGKISTNVYNQYGKVALDLWTDTKIVFQVPLHWKTGEITVWVEKPNNWEGKDLMLKSNQVKFQLLETSGPWDKNDDAYFDQLRHLDKETLKINGYNSDDYK